MKKLLPIALFCVALLGCSKDDGDKPACPEQQCAVRAQKTQTSTGIIVTGKDCENKALPCKKYCLEHNYGNVD